MNETKNFGFQTNSIHAGEKRPTIEGAVGMPIFQNTTYEVSGAKSYDAVRYTRLSNSPNHLALAEKLSELERCEEALVTASGMAAITTALLALVPPGGHVVAQSALYGGTHAFLTEDWEKLGRTYSYFDVDDFTALERELARKPAVLYVEAISNPLMKIPDLAKIVAFGKKAGALLVIDNTFCSPYFFNPSQLGFDLAKGRALVVAATAGVTDLALCDRGLIRSAVDAMGGSLADPALASRWWELRAEQNAFTTSLQVSSTPSNQHRVYEAVCAAAKRDDTEVATHISRFDRDGAVMFFSLNPAREHTVAQCLAASTAAGAYPLGATLPQFENYFRSLRGYLDPHDIMNPGALRAG